MKFKCECGNEFIGLFCDNCGKKREENNMVYLKGTSNWWSYKNIIGNYKSINNDIVSKLSISDNGEVVFELDNKCTLKGNFVFNKVNNIIFEYDNNNINCDIKLVDLNNYSVIRDIYDEESLLEFVFDNNMFNIDVIIFEKVYDKTIKYKVDGVLLENDLYAEGDDVKFMVPFMTDCSISVTSNEVKIKRIDSDNYSFVMPKCDVHIDVNIVNDMINPYYNGTSNNEMGFMGMQMRMNMEDFNKLN